MTATCMCWTASRAGCRQTSTRISNRRHGGSAAVAMPQMMNFDYMDNRGRWQYLSVRPCHIVLTTVAKVHRGSLTPFSASSRMTSPHGSGHEFVGSNAASRLPRDPHVCFNELGAPLMALLSTTLRVRTRPTKILIRPRCAPVASC